MRPTRRKVLSLVVVAASLVATVAPLTAATYVVRQRYGGWSYYPTTQYYYRYYYYKPTPSYPTYQHHYCIYYHSQPNYVYYYNPVSRVYWGRYDLHEGGYSLLAEKDRNGDLKKIPESAFPKPGEMPVIPESSDGERILKPDPNDLPSADTPSDVPGGAKP